VRVHGSNSDDEVSRAQHESKDFPIEKFQDGWINCYVRRRLRYCELNQVADDSCLQEMEQ
jgi:hypothetical protein